MDPEILAALKDARDWRHPGELLTAYMDRDPDFPIWRFDTGSLS
jgi:hypothetical protein